MKRGARKVGRKDNEYLTMETQMNLLKRETQLMLC